MKVIELTVPQVLMAPEVQKILKAAISSDVLLAPGGFDTLAGDLIEFVESPNHFILLGAEDGAFKTVLMGYFPSGQLFPYPTVILFYSEGTPTLREATQQKYIDLMLSRGYTKTLAVNGSKRSDKAWQKVLTPEGTTSKIIGSLAMFEV